LWNKPERGGFEELLFGYGEERFLGRMLVFSVRMGKSLGRILMWDC
jgi:hypothetical protein